MVGASEAVADGFDVIVGAIDTLGNSEGEGDGTAVSVG
jgi:hypothetical protein